MARPPSAPGPDARVIRFAAIANHLRLAAGGRGGPSIAVSRKPGNQLRISAFRVRGPTPFATLDSTGLSEHGEGGWLASKVMKTDAQQGIILNIVVGVVGAALAGFLISPLLGIPTINAANFSIGGLLISFLGALILLAIVNFFRRGRVR
jgi:uncharacterized membrane protein YeaQ/YmgE (transglycosylase-associated protein family)